jgi:hypothetical protein
VVTLVVAPPFRQRLLRRFWRRPFFRSNVIRASPLRTLLKGFHRRMAQPSLRDNDHRPSTPFRRLGNFVGAYIDTKIGPASRSVTESGPKNVLEEQLIHQETVNAKDAESYARVKPNLSKPNSEHGLSK